MTFSFFLVSVCTAAFAFVADVKASDLAIVNAKVYTDPTASAIQSATVLIHNGRIDAVGAKGSVTLPRDATVIDGSGKVVVAGFWNCHVHIFTHALLHAEQRSATELNASLDEMLNRWGFTTVFDLASILDNTNQIRARIRKGEVRGPTILTVGEPFFPFNGTPVYVRDFVASEHITLPEITSIPNALAREKKEIAAGADGVKLFTGDIVGGTIGVEPMPLPLAKALVAEAHREHRPVFAHPTNLEGLNVAIDSGVDVLAHTADGSGPWGPEMLARLRARNMALIPTLTLFEVEGKKDGAPPEQIAKVEALVQGQLRDFRASGGQILFGTDVGYTAAFDTSEEFRLMAAAGMDWRAILTSLTTAPASRFGYASKKGIIAKGMDADLVVLDADPSEDITAFSKVRETINGGRVIYSNGGD